MVNSGLCTENLRDMKAIADKRFVVYSVKSGALDVAEERPIMLVNFDSWIHYSQPKAANPEQGANRQLENSGPSNKENKGPTPWFHRELAHWVGLHQTIWTGP